MKYLVKTFAFTTLDPDFELTKKINKYSNEHSNEYVLKESHVVVKPGGASFLLCIFEKIENIILS